MSEVDSNGWWPVVQALRQDQEIISKQWQTSRKQYNDLNLNCDRLIQSMWVSHALNFALHKVLSHRLPPSEWILAREESSAVQYVDAAQVMDSTLRESYSRFLGNIRTQPPVVYEVLQWAGREGLDTGHLTHDIISVVYGHCLYKEDHCYLLETICCSLRDHISHCGSIKELFSIEPVCSRLIMEYCHQLPELKVFLAQVLKKPLHKVVEKHSEYLEYDLAKAGTRFHCEGEEEKEEGEGGVDFEEYVDASSRFIAETCMVFLYELNLVQNHFPPSLQWLLGSLKGFILDRWPSEGISLRRPISHVLFGFIISSAFVNPDLLGVLDVHVTLSDAMWYNISQVIGVLQGCAWIVDKLDSSDYPMRRVVKYMDMIPFNAVIDSIDGGLNYSSPPPVTSMLPGLTRSVFLFSRVQLENIVGTFYDACNSFMDLPEVSPPRLDVNKAISVIPDAIINKGRRNPYSFSLTNVHRVGSQPLLEKDDFSLSTSTKSPKPKRSKNRSKSSVWGPSRPERFVDSGSKSYTLGSRSVHKSPSNPSINVVSPSHSVDFNMTGLSQEVIILSVWKPDIPEFNRNSWNIQLLSEEEFTHSRSKSVSPTISAVAIIEEPSLETSPELEKSLSTNEVQEDKPLDTLEVTPLIDEKNSIKSWSPETYNGSLSGEENNLIPENVTLTKSCEPLAEKEKVPSLPHSSSVPATSTAKKGFRAWLGKKMSRSKSSRKNVVSDEAEPGGATPLEKRRSGSYTKRVGHITAKYERISQERKASEILASQDEISKEKSPTPMTEAAKKWLNKPVTLKELISSNLYEQLKYKLTVTLQNIHIPFQLSVNDETPGSNLKSELVGLLEIAHHFTEWNGDYSECGILTEILSQLKDLNSDCIRALLSGVKENHFAHLEYLNYLSTFQQECHNAHLQISHLQNTIQRARKLQEDSFLNFTIRMFFEERSAKLDQVKRDLEHCQTSDDKYVLLQDFREALRTSLEKDVTWQIWAEDLEEVHRICDDRVYASLYDYVFYPNGDSDKQRDEVFYEYIQRISSTVTPQHKLLKISPIYYTSHPWLPVQELLHNISLYKSPQAKLDCIAKACKLLIRLLQLAKCGDPPGADDIFPVLVYILIQVNPMSLLSTEQYIKVFCEDQLIGGETAYWWTQFCSAVDFLKTPEFTQEQS